MILNQNLQLINEEMCLLPMETEWDSEQVIAQIWVHTTPVLNSQRPGIETKVRVRPKAIRP